jgi:hypothetical protein
MKLLRHPLSTAFGSLSDEEFAGLEASILKIGLQDAICLLDGQVLDGWNRYRICDKHGLPMRTFNLQDGIDPRDYVIAKNAERRHLSAGQRALAVAEVFKWKPPFRPKIEKAAATAGLSDAPKTTAELADIAGVSARTMEHAKAVVQKAAPELREAVQEGTLSVERAAHLASKLPKEEQPIAAMDRESAPALEANGARHDKKAPHAAPVGDDVIALHSRIAALEADNEDLREKNAAGAAMLQELHDDLLAAGRVIDASEGADRIKAALAEAKRFRDEFRVQEDRMRGLMEEKNAAVRAAKSWERKANGTAARVRH